MTKDQRNNKEKKLSPTNGISTNGDGRGKNPKSLANLKPSTPGMTNNPNGRPPGTRGLTMKLRELINGQGFLETQAEIIDKETREPTGEIVDVRVFIPRLEAIVNTALKMAQKGDMKAIEFVWNKYEGTDNTLNLRLGLLDDPDKASDYAQKLRDAANT